MQKILICDIDNTVGDQLERLKRCIDSTTGRVNIDLAYSPEMVMSDKPLHGSVSGLNMFKSKGFKIIWLSARKRILKDPTRGWLINNGFPVDEVILVNKLADKIPIIKEINPTLVIDDCMYNWQELEPKLATDFIAEVNKMGVDLVVFSGSWSEVMRNYF